MQPKTFKELEEAVKSKQIVSATRKNGKVDRFFISSCGQLCFFAPRSGKRGYVLSLSSFDDYVKFKSRKVKTDEERQKSDYNVIAKYKKLASQASFTNNFIEICKNLPTLEEWKKDLKTDRFGTPCEPTNKTLYDYSVTTGNKIDGKVISLSRIEKKYPRVIQQLREAIANKTAVGTIASRYDFAGYEMTISVEDAGDGMIQGFLSLEYKGCLNGYYYLLINDENFIGYDVD